MGNLLLFQLAEIQFSRIRFGSRILAVEMTAFFKRSSILRDRKKKKLRAIFPVPVFFLAIIVQ